MYPQGEVRSLNSFFDCFLIALIICYEIRYSRFCFVYCAHTHWQIFCLFIDILMTRSPVINLLPIVAYNRTGFQLSGESDFAFALALPDCAL